MLDKLVSILAITTALAGCGAPPAAQGEDPSAFKFWPPPVVLAAPAFVEWQFQSCLTQDQRDGLILALQQLHAQTLPQLEPSVGLSQCGSDGEERGALFPTSSSAAGRNRTLSWMSIRPLQRSYAFAIDPLSYQALASYQWTYLPKTFNDAGVWTTNGRYQVTGYSETTRQNTPTSLWTVETLHFLDTQRHKSVDISYPVVTDLDTAKGTIVTGKGGYQITPASSTDPFVQTVINAAKATLTKSGLWFTPAYYVGDLALDFSQAPSLNGWPMPFDLMFMDDSGDVIVAGGELIM